MKRKVLLAITLIVVWLCSLPISLTGQNPDINLMINSIRIQVVTDRGTGDNHPFHRDLVKGYFLKSLRQIPNVIIVGEDPFYTIHFLADMITSDTYRVVYVVRRTLNFEGFTRYVYPEYRESLPKLFENAGYMETYGYFGASSQGLERECNAFITRNVSFVSFDNALEHGGSFRHFDAYFHCHAPCCLLFESQVA